MYALGRRMTVSVVQGNSALNHAQIFLLSLDRECILLCRARMLEALSTCW